MIVLTQQLILADNAPLLYLPMYKLGQDHVELFFGNIRLKGGWNNNPSAQQFSAAYKKLLINTQVGTTTGNCLPLSAISILSVSSSKPVAVDVINMTTLESDRLTDQELCSAPECGEHDYLFLPHALSVCAENVVYYVSGFVARKMMLKLKCAKCVDALYLLEPNRNQKSLICYKDRGFLVYPSDDVFKICKVCETHFRKFVAEGRVMTSSAISSLKVHVVQELLGVQLFNSLKSHELEFESLDNHCSHLIYAIAEAYFQTRVKHHGRSFVERCTSKRHMFNKLVLFKGQ